MMYSPPIDARLLLLLLHRLRQLPFRQSRHGTAAGYIGYTFCSLWATDGKNGLLFVGSRRWSCDANDAWPTKTTHVPSVRRQPPQRSAPPRVE
jgi:hypothetical protein